MDPVEERDIQKVLAVLDDPRVIEKIAEKLWIPGHSTGKIIPRENVVEHTEEKSGIKN